MEVWLYQQRSLIIITTEPQQENPINTDRKSSSRLSNSRRPGKRAGRKLYLNAGAYQANKVPGAGVR